MAASRRFISLGVALLRTITAPAVGRQFVIRGVNSRLALSGEDIYQLTGTRRETINRTHWELSDVLLFFGNALLLVVFLDTPLDGVLFVRDANAPNYLSGNAIAPAAPEREICTGEIASEEYKERRAKLLRDANVE